jgi:hypothetical protein
MSFNTVSRDCVAPISRFSEERQRTTRSVPEPEQRKKALKELREATD